PAGKYELLLRARNGAKLWIDGKEVASTPFFSISGSAHGTIRDWRVIKDDAIRHVQPGDHEVLAALNSTGDPVEIRLEMYIGGGSQRPETGEAGLFLRREGSSMFHLVGHDIDVPLTDAAMLDFLNRQRADLEVI